MNEPDKIKEILASGIKITEAICDAVVAKGIANQFKREIGFVNLSALKKSEKCDELEVVGEGVGFAHFHHRRDGQTTIYEIAVRKESQGQGWGRLLFYRVLCSAIERGQSSVFLKCPTDNKSNGFYEKIGFALECTEPGKKRPLNCWRYAIRQPLLFYCADGGRNKYGKTAQKAGWFLGYNSRETRIRTHRVQMIDNDFRDYNHARHLGEVMHHKPLIATVLDIMTPENVGVIIEQAKELAQFCGRVILIPKRRFDLPNNFKFWLGYSVPTSHGATSVPCEFFDGYNVHLLGGSPQSQAHYAQHLKVVSLDGNYAMRISAYGKVVHQGTSTNGRKIPGISGAYACFEESLERQRLFWHGDPRQNHRTESITQVDPIGQLSIFSLFE